MFEKIMSASALHEGGPPPGPTRDELLELVANG
jgi:hypothetical protein